jgi:hypothetical protein
MLYAGLDLSRQKPDAHILDETGRTVEILAVRPDAIVPDSTGLENIAIARATSSPTRWSRAYPHHILVTLVWWTSTGVAGQLVDKPLVQMASNMHSESRPKGPTFTVEPDWRGISGTVPGDRADDRKVAGNGPSGGLTIASNRDCWSASRQTAGSFGRFVVLLMTKAEAEPGA